MKRLKRTPDIKPDQALSLTNIAGAPERTFPSGMIDDLRRMVSRLAGHGQLPERLAVTSALREEGVTTIACGLATLLANDLAAQVCLIDLNWWWPAPSILHTAANEGVAGVLAGSVTLEEVLAPTGLPNLTVLPAGATSEVQRPIIARSAALRELMDELSQRFNYLVLDVPAILASNDAIPLASLAPTCCLVIRQGVTRVSDVQLALDEISHLTIAGVILNKTKLKTPQALLRLISTS